MDIVTGGFGYTGRFIMQRLTAEGGRVRTLTNHPKPLRRTAPTRRS
jgi:uncharacterized protein YbjT (DUF2867 family)